MERSRNPFALTLEVYKWLIARFELSSVTSKRETLVKSTSVA